MRKKHIVCFGDSNTHGYCAVTGGRFDETQRWCCLLQEKLGRDFLVIEEGLSGRTTSFTDPIHEGLNGLDSIYSCLMSHEPVDLLVIMLGTNDTKERFGASAACISLGLKRLLHKAISTTDCWNNGKANILVVSPQNIDKRYESSDVGETMGRGCAEKSQGLAEKFAEIAQLAGCHFMDANKVLTAPVNDIDYMHLTLEGHRQLADALAKKITELFVL